MAESEIHELLKIGLTEGEAKVYLALLELGSSTVGPVVKKANVAYSNIYEILQRLLEKGLVSYIIKSKTKYFQAAQPSQLSVYLDKQEKGIQEQRHALRTMLPVFQQMQGIAVQQEAEIFVGMKGLRTAYERLILGISRKDEQLFFYIHEKEYAVESDRFYISIQDILKRVKKMRGLCNEAYRTSSFYKVATFIDTRFVKFPIPGNIEICKDRLLLVSWEKPVIAVLIHSQSIADNFRNYFNAVWDVAKR